MFNVYRLENCHGIGPYASEKCHHPDMTPDEYNSLKEFLYSETVDKYKLPGKCDFKGLVDDISEYRFGFASLEQLYSWFQPELVNRLQEAGYIIKTETVSEYISGLSGLQIIFK